MIKYSIVIPTYNHLDDLKSCIESIIKTTDLKNVEVIVSANGCTDGTKEYVESLGKPFKLIWNDNALGYTKATNLGIKKAKGEFIILMNNDAYITDSPKNLWLSKLELPFLVNPKTGLSGPLVAIDPITNHKFIVFFLVMIKKEVIEKIGILDEIFSPGFGEDIDFCIRAQNEGYWISQAPKDGATKIEGNLVIGDFPAFHAGEKTVHDSETDWAQFGYSSWQNVIDKNQSILKKRYVDKIQETPTEIIESGSPEDKEYEYLLNAIITNNEYFVNKDDIEGKSVIDIGANIGIFSKMISEFAPLSILAIKPEQKNFENLKENTKDIKKITLLNKAIHNKTGVKLYLENDAALTKVSSKKTKKVCETISLQDILSIFPSEDLVLKMDIEGHEYKVLYETEKAVLKKCKTIFIELHDEQNKTDKILEAKNFILGLGYDLVHSKKYTSWIWGPNGEKLNEKDEPVEICKFVRKEEFQQISKKLVHIITPTFQRHEELKRLLEHIGNQTHREFISWVCSDGPDEVVQKIVKEYSIKYNFEANYLFTPTRTNNWGADQRAMVLGQLPSNENEFVVFVDDDNIIFPTYIEKLLSGQDGNHKISYCNVELNNQYVLGLMIPGKDERNHFREGFIDTMNVMVELNLAKEMIPAWQNGAYSCDYNFINECSKKTLSTFIPEFLGIHGYNLVINRDTTNLSGQLEMFHKESEDHLPFGFFTEANIKAYNKLIRDVPDNGIVAEIGVYEGRSLCSVADLIIEKKLTVYAIDTFKGSPGEQIPDEIATELDLQNKFISNIKKFKLENNVRLLVGMNNEVAKNELQDVKFDFVFIDANHQTEPVRQDVLTWKYKLTPTGVLAGHDWDNPLVETAVRGLLEDIKTDGNIWFWNFNPNEKIRVTASISTRNRYFTTLPLTLTAIANQTYLPTKILIYDDGDKLDLREEPLYQNILSLFAQKGIELFVAWAEGKGQVLNHQRTLYDAPTEWIWRLDDDNIPEANVLEILVSNIKDDVGAVAGLILDPKTNTGPNPNASNKIEDVYTHANEQWHRFTGTKEVDHLYSSFLFRKHAALQHGGYCMELSRVGHREETIFTHEMKRNGWKLIIDPTAITWHYHYPQGGIRDNTKEEMWRHDEQIFNQKMTKWKLDYQGIKLFVLDNGLGDHIAFRTLLPEIRKKYIGKSVIIAACFPEVFEDDNDVNLISIGDAGNIFGSIDEYNVYRFMEEHNWKRPLIEAFKELYKI